MRDRYKLPLCQNVPAGWDAPGAEQHREGTGKATGRHQGGPGPVSPSVPATPRSGYWGGSRFLNSSGSSN